MRGRRPRPLEIAPHDVPILQQIARSRGPTPLVSSPTGSGPPGRRRGGEPIRTLAIRTQCNPSTVWRICRRYEDAGLPDLRNHPYGPGDRPGFSPWNAAQIVQLACLEPVAKGLHITHWTSQDLARQAVEDGIVPAISDRTVQAILNQVDLQPHRTRYWRTLPLASTLTSRSVPRRSSGATPTPSGWPGGASGWSVPMRNPTSKSWNDIPSGIRSPGSIAQREFDYTRHGTVNILFFLIVHSGQMEAACFDAKSAEHYVQELRAFRHRHRHLRGVYLIHDNDPTHTAAKTRDYLAGGSGWWRSRFTPVHASWLDEAELLVGAFGYHYLKRGSWHSRAEFIDYVRQAWPEYNRLYAHPFEWTWSSQKMRQWVEKHGL